VCRPVVAVNRYAHKPRGQAQLRSTTSNSRIYAAVTVWISLPARLGQIGAMSQHDPQRELAVFGRQNQRRTQVEGKVGKPMRTSEHRASEGHERYKHGMPVMHVVAIGRDTTLTHGHGCQFHITLKSKSTSNCKRVRVCLPFQTTDVFPSAGLSKNHGLCIDIMACLQSTVWCTRYSRNFEREFVNKYINV
jgi:hypothetical protein